MGCNVSQVVKEAGLKMVSKSEKIIVAVFVKHRNSNELTILEEDG
jgi:hypothetical protein